MKTIKICLLIYFIISIFSLKISNCQISFNSLGNTVENETNVAYSVGQVFYTSSFMDYGSVLNGVQQAYEIYLIYEDELMEEISVNIFPNPSLDNLTIQVNTSNKGIYYYHIIDANGKVLEKGIIENELTSVNINNFISSVYFISIMDIENKIIQTLKFVKY